MASELLEPLIKYLRAIKEVNRVEVAGSFRRGQETVGDIDILVSSSQPLKVVRHFTAYEHVSEVRAQGSTRASVVLRQGLPVDLRIVGDLSFGAAMHYFTGSKAHNIALRTLARERQLKMNEYGVFSGTERLAGATEASVFHALGLSYIEPELRENRGEIAAARAGRLPLLIERSDLRGDLHTHTKSTDGRNSLREMALAAQQRGLAYLGITDHSQRWALRHGLDPDSLSRQIDEIDKLNAELDGITLLKGIEVEIKEDGDLDLPDSILSRLDLVVAAVHSQFTLSRERQTGRILRAMDHRYFTLLAHPTGRLLLEREPYDIDMLRIIGHAKQRGCSLELNAQPRRLDLSANYCMLAKDEGVLISINSDAHSIYDLDDLRFGVQQARRGWLEKNDVLNTMSIGHLKAQLSKMQGN